jgi:hypothetical protein
MPATSARGAAPSDADLANLRGDAGITAAPITTEMLTGPLAKKAVTADTQNWGKKKVQLCGPSGRPRGQAAAKQRQNQNR